MTVQKLKDLSRRIHELQMLISDANLAGRGGLAGTAGRIRYVRSSQPGLRRQLDALLSRLGEKDPLRDNLLLEKANLIADDQGRAERRR